MLARVLPAPIHQYKQQEQQELELEEERKELNNLHELQQQQQQRVLKNNIPKYLQRSSFIPHKLEDFGDGGAFPEIHVVQYPLNMGRPGAKSTAVVSVNVDEKGEVKYDAIVKQGSNQNKIVRASFDDLKESSGDAVKLDLPSKEEEDKVADATRLALEALLDGKIKKAKPTGPVTSNTESEEPKYIRYTPNPNLPGTNSDAKQRIIRMVEAQVDPLEPPKHKIKKVPKGGGSPPVPVLHSPPRNLTVKDQQAWKIPPCISNWKNARGYTIPLDKRLAADGRGLQDVTINNKFASLSESLYIAERKAAEDLRIRNQIRKKMAMKEKEDKEKELREMANKARMERAGILTGNNTTNTNDISGNDRNEQQNNELSDDFDDDDDDNDRNDRNDNKEKDNHNKNRSVSPKQQSRNQRSRSSPSPSSSRSSRSKSPSKSPSRSRSRSNSNSRGSGKNRSDNRRSRSRSDSRGRERERGGRSNSKSESESDIDDYESRREKSYNKERHHNDRSKSPIRTKKSNYDSGGHRYNNKNSSRNRQRSSSSERNHQRKNNKDQNKNHDEERGGRYGETDEEKTARLQRERLRIERRKERERELRLENMKGTMRKNKIDRDMNRDVSEKIALGMHKGSGQLGGEAMYDARLFNQSSGMDSGFGLDDEYNTYSKPLFDRQAADSIYRPKRDDSDIYGDVDTQMAKLQDTSKFKPDKGFRGAEGNVKGEKRTAPVQFEKHTVDPFGIDEIVDGSNRKKTRRDD